MNDRAAPEPDQKPEPGRRSLFSRLRSMLRVPWYVVVLLVGLGLLAGTGTYVYRSVTMPGPLAADKVVIVPKGAGLMATASALKQAGATRSGWIFVVLARAKAAPVHIKFGEYRIPARSSMIDVLRILQSGKVIQHRLTFPEGLSSREMMAILNATPLLDGTVADVPPDGTLLPETYFYTYGENRSALVARMKAAMERAVEAAWGARPLDFPLKTPAEMVTLASIVEKETGIAGERPRVAAVFLNRLKKGMRLQSDPTVIYGITGGGPLARPLSRTDLDTATPFNTYAVDGLPPGPIANPGREALRAVVTPASGQDLYFVADGTGGHLFAETLDEHNRNVARWRKIERGEDPDAEPAPPPPVKKTAPKKKKRRR